MTADTIDTINALMACFVAGSLPQPAHVLVEPHLGLKPDNRRFVRGLEELAGRTLEDSRAIDLIPTHTHNGSELTLVLDGAFTDLTGTYRRGDISVADDSVEHRPVGEMERPCICFAVTDAPLRFSGILRQRLSDLIGV